MRVDTLLVAIVITVATIVTAATAVSGVAGGWSSGTAVAADADLGAAEVLALRGNSAVAPENTLAAVEAAVEAGAARVWLDVRQTADGVPVVLHDAMLDRTTDCSGPVAEQPADVVTACRAGSWFVPEDPYAPRFDDQTIPTLAAALAVPGVRPALMLHDVAPAAVLEVVAGAALEVDLVVASTRGADLAAVAAERPDARTYLRDLSLNAQVRARAVDAGADGVAVDAGALTPRAVGEARGAGLEIVAVDVPDEHLLFDLLAIDVTRWVTARVGPTKRALDYTFRTYDGRDFGRALDESDGFPGALTTGDFDDDGRLDLVVSAPFDSSRAPSGGWLGVAMGGVTFPGLLTDEAGTERNGEWGAVVDRGDFNDDGYDDLVVGVPRRDFSGLDSGTLWLWEGARSGVGALSRPIGPDSAAGDNLGHAVAVGDFNGDGIDDLAVSAPETRVAGNASAGQVTVLPGRAGAGPVTDGALTIDRTLELVPGEPTARERLGATLVAADFDGDGDDDLAVGVPGATVDGAREAGSVLLVYGAEDASTGDVQTFKVEEIGRAADDIPGTPARLDGFGAVLAAADFDRDFFADLVIGAPGAIVGGRRAAGEVIVRYGVAGGFDPARTRAISQGLSGLPGAPGARDGFGEALTTGDLDGDGYPELVVGTPGESVRGLPAAGSTTVIYGGRYGLQARAALELAPGMWPVGLEAANRQAFGSVLTVGDLNGDERADLAIGVPGQTIDDVTEAGALVVAWGPDETLPGVPTATPRPPTPTPRPTITPTPRPTATPLPLEHIYVPYLAKLWGLGRYPTPPAQAGSRAPRAGHAP